MTPVVAVLHELKERDSSIEIKFWCDKKFAPQATDILEKFDAALKVETVVAGKLRRYHHITFLQHFTIPSILWPNIRDFFLVFIGVVQSLCKLVAWRPSVVFAKGGYVCLPVGWAARLLGIPLVIHDSDAHPGLTNRLLARHAAIIATGSPLGYYKYPPKKTRYVGIPISKEFRVFTAQERRVAKEQLGMDPSRPLIVVTGGGLGARQLNDAVLLHLKTLLENMNVVLISGREQFDGLRALTPKNDPRFMLFDFVSGGMADMLGAADVVVSRAGATTLLELAALAKPTVLVPSSRLVWQVKHAKMYSDESAVVLLDETKITDADDRTLADVLTKLVSNKRLQLELARNIHGFAKPHAASDMAALILRAGGIKSRRTSATIDHK